MSRFFRSGFLGAAAFSLGLAPSASLAQCVILPDEQGELTPHLVVNREPVAIEPAFEDYAYMLYDACDAMGLTFENDCDILPMMGEINFNAVATQCGGQKVIIYDRRLSPMIGYDGAQAVMAHELGHHFCGHLTETPGSVESSHRIEAEADAFAGAVMRGLGVSLERALAYEPLLAQHAAHSHPSKTVRLGSLARGWLDPDFALRCEADGYFPQ